MQAVVSSQQASRPAPARPSMSVRAAKPVYLLVSFAVRNGEFEDYHKAVFTAQDKSELKNLKRDAMAYALFFYDSLDDYAEEEGLDSEKGLSKAIRYYKSQGGFNNGGGEVMIRDVQLRTITKFEYDCFEVVRKL